MAQKEELLQKLADYVVDMEDEDIVDVAEEYVAAGFDPQEGILQGLVVGMQRASDLYDEGEYFVPELINCSDAMYAGMDIMQAHMEHKAESIGKAVIGVVQGDTHDIGKSLVRVMMEVAGIEVVDLGRDVSLDRFVEVVRDDEDIDLVVMSSLMTTTMIGMGKVIEGLKEAGLRDRVKVMVGGAPISNGFAKEIGADLYTTNAIQAAEGAKRLLGK